MFLLSKRKGMSFRNLGKKVLGVFLFSMHDKWAFDVYHISTGTLIPLNSQVDSLCAHCSHAQFIPALPVEGFT